MSAANEPLAARVVRVRLLVCREVGYETADPWIAGAIDESLWEICPEEETDAMFAAMRENWAADTPQECREVVVEVPLAALVAMLATPTIRADVSSVGAPGAETEGET